MLSERGQAILRTVAVPIFLGYSPAEVARGLEISKRSISGMLDELRAELEQPRRLDA
jgi:DNA-binding CsgD family transcriptional regulator